MALDYSVRRPTRRCSATDRELSPGEGFVSVLVDEGSEVVRRDYALSDWNEPPEHAIAWWRSEMPGGGKPTPAPREVLLSLLDEWADHPEQASARYLLALLLVRRRILSPQAESFAAGFRGEDRHAEDATTLKLVSRDRAEPIEVTVAPPSADDAPRVQARLAELLGAA
ncbi:MAG: hypothetical protein AAF266_02725 [Planctomycetota bacterium]